MINSILKKFNLWISIVFPREFEKFAAKGKNLIGVEIGVYKGEHAESMLKELNIKKLYLIDPYESYAENLNNFPMGEKNDLKDIEDEAYAKLIRYNNKIEWIIKKSSDAINDIKEKVDFVYIDGNHEYKYVKKDIEDYWKLVKEGGVLGGDDFFNGMDNQHDGVINAVIEFATKMNLQLHVEGRDWWMYKIGENK